MDSDEGQSFVALASAPQREYYRLRLQGTNRTSVPSLARGKGERNCDSDVHLSHSPHSKHQGGAAFTMLLSQSCTCAHRHACSLSARASSHEGLKYPPLCTSFKIWTTFSKTWYKCTIISFKGKKKCTQ